jgi:pimeloyl-ACP methyl ester carboxylesterase
MIQERFLIFAAVLMLVNAAVSSIPALRPPAALQNGTFKARLNNVEISYTVGGSGPVMLVQGAGWGLDSRLYQNTLKFLEANYTLVYIDPRGTGEAAPIADQSQLTSDFMADDLEALRQHLGLNRMVLLGHAHGGFIAMKYALKYPNRLAQLILVDCILLRNLEDNTREVSEILQRHPRRKDPKWEAALTTFKSEYDARTVEALRENLQATAILYFNYYGPSQRALFEKSLREGKLSINNFDQFVRHDLLRYDLNGQESRITAPVLLLYGLYDPYFIRATARQLHFAMRNSKLELFERSGHYPWMEEPQHFAEVLKAFLNPPAAPVITETSRVTPQNQ